MIEAFGEWRVFTPDYGWLRRTEEGLKIDQWILNGQEPIEEGSVPAESDS